MLRFTLGEIFIPEEKCISRRRDAMLVENQSQEVSAKEKVEIVNDLILIATFCKRMDLKGAIRAIEHFLLKIRMRDVPLCQYDVAHGFGSIELNMGEDLVPLQFAFVPPEKVEFFEQEKLFGEKVFNRFRFKPAHYDIKEAGNCRSTGANTACVFHLMRAVECGMRELAIHLKPKIKLPLEYCDWKGLIKPMEKKLAKIELKRRGPKKSKQFEFYTCCVSDCKSFTETRNRVSHARQPFSEDEAKTIMERVKAFMVNIATLETPPTIKKL
jgi:hypothetical protein